MSRPVLIDSSMWIEAIRARGDADARERVHSLLRAGQARFCDFVRLELWNGVGGEAERRWLASLEEALETVPTDQRVWKEARQLASTARLRGVTVPAGDLLIAACARVHGLDLLHRDGHFDLLAALDA